MTSVAASNTVGIPQPGLTGASSPTTAPLGAPAPRPQSAPGPQSAPPTAGDTVERTLTIPLPALPTDPSSIDVAKLRGLILSSVDSGKVTISGTLPRGPKTIQLSRGNPLNIMIGNGATVTITAELAPTPDGQRVRSLEVSFPTGIVIQNISALDDSFLASIGQGLVTATLKGVKMDAAGRLRVLGTLERPGLLGYTTDDLHDWAKKKLPQLDTRLESILNGKAVVSQPDGVPKLEIAGLVASIAKLMDKQSVTIDVAGKTQPLNTTVGLKSLEAVSGSLSAIAGATATLEGQITASFHAGVTLAMSGQDGPGLIAKDVKVTVVSNGAKLTTDLLNAALPAGLEIEATVDKVAASKAGVVVNVPATLKVGTTTMKVG